MRKIQVDPQELLEAANKARNNHSRFGSFMLFTDFDGEADQWAILYTSNRDSDLLTESNAHVIAQELQPFIDRTETCVEFGASHWACGHVDGYAIRPFTRKGVVTRAFRKWFELQQRIDDYPVLDEEDLSEREQNALWENAKFECRYADITEDENQVSEILEWLSEHDQGETENRDGRGAYPSAEALKAAAIALGIIQEETKKGARE